MESRWSLTLKDNPDPAVRQEILAPLIAYNEAAGGPSRGGITAITVRNDMGVVVGGLCGRAGYDFLFIELLCLGPARDIGLGRQIMAIAEAEARRRDLTGMWLDTFTFQAPDFYPKFGFKECGRISGYPPEHDRIFYVKRFTDA